MKTSTHILSEKELIEYRKFLYADEYKDGVVPDDVLNPPPRTDEEIEQDCADAFEFGFKYYSYCPHCHDGFFGASGLDINENKMNRCPICNYNKVQVYNSETKERLL